MYPYFVQTFLLFSPPDFCISIKKPGDLLCQWILSLINHTFYGKRGLILYDSVSAASQKLPHLKILNWQSSICLSVLEMGLKHHFRRRDSSSNSCSWPRGFSSIISFMFFSISFRKSASLTSSSPPVVRWKLLSFQPFSHNRKRPSAQTQRRRLPEAEFPEVKNCGRMFQKECIIFLTQIDGSYIPVTPLLLCTLAMQEIPTKLFTFSLTGIYWILRTF